MSGVAALDFCCNPATQSMNNRRYSPRPLVSFILLSLALLHASVTVSLAGMLPAERIYNGGYIISSGGGGRILEQHNSKQLFIPASTIKLLTALVTLDTLGQDYQFDTRFYQDSAGILYVQGSGDPFLTSEYLTIIAKDLGQKGLRKITDIVLDDSVFALEPPLPEGSENSHNPYDAANSGLAVNFNSVALLKKKDYPTFSGEPQTPLTPIGREIGRSLPPGQHRINIGSHQTEGNILPSLLYTGELLQAMLEREGIPTSGEIRQGRVTATADHLYTYISPMTVTDLVRSCLKFSNNFIANQLALVAGARTYGYPATWSKARRLLQEYASTTLKIPAEEAIIREGSGLSRRNQITPAALLTIVEAFHPHRHLLDIKQGVQLKSGTLKAVFSYAGYLETTRGPVSFVFLLNQKKNIRDMLLRSLKTEIERELHPVSDKQKDSQT